MAAKPPVVWSPEARADLSTIWDYYSSTLIPRPPMISFGKLVRLSGFCRNIRKLAGHATKFG
jgi:hypothetical protein